MVVVVVVVVFMLVRVIVLLPFFSEQRFTAVGRVRPSVRPSVSTVSFEPLIMWSTS